MIPGEARAQQKLVSSIRLGLLVVLAIMPVHAFMSVALAHVIGHQSVIQAWKEVLLLILGGLSLALILLDRSRLSRLRQPWAIACMVFISISLIVTAVARPNLAGAVFGIKTDLEFLIAALIAAVVANKQFVYRASRIILIGAAIVSGFDVLQIFVLPADFLTQFGYGVSTIMPYQHIAEGTSALRYPSTLGGPNQLGTYLILPICLTTALYMRERKWWQLGLLLAMTLSIIWSFSRSAWLGAGLAVFVTIIANLAKSQRKRAFTLLSLLVLAALFMLPIALDANSPIQYFLLHSSVANHDQAGLSDAQHAQSLSNGLDNLALHPWGYGLGTAGPATFHINMPNIIENFYLQLGYETGLLGLSAFLVVLVALIRRLWTKRATEIITAPIIATILGISVVALVLPAWVDSSTSLIVWIIAGSVAGLPLTEPRNV